jgi:hypothetical protein
MKRWQVILLWLTAMLVSCQNETPLFNESTDVNDPGLKSVELQEHLSWPGVFDPSHVISLYFRMTEEDWNTVRFDASNSVLKPAWFRAAGEEEIKVELRRKSSRALPSEEDPWKVGMKVSINYVSGQIWRGLNKLSLENGSDVGPVAEGVAWNLHQLASLDGFYGEDVNPGLAAWVKVYVKVCPSDDGEGFLLKDDAEVVEEDYHYLGVYINVEQRNKRFMQNRNVYKKNYTWLYEVDDINVSVVDVGLEGEEGGPHSETYGALAFSPFQTVSSGSSKKSKGTTLTDAELKARLDQYINMDAMLTQGAVDAFSTNPDALFSHGKNFKFIDFQSGYVPVGFGGDTRRLYLPWDLDAVFGRTDFPIYGVPGGRNKITQTNYQDIILNHPEYREQYNRIMSELLEGPLHPDLMSNRLDEWKTAADQALKDDPYETYGKHMNFDDMKLWISKRVPAVKAMVSANNQPAPRD